MMKQYTVGVEVRCKKLLKVSARNEKEAICKADVVMFDTDAVKFNDEDVVSTVVGIEPPMNDCDGGEDESEPCDIYCSGCPDYVPLLNFCKKDGACGEEYDFPPAFGGKNG